MMADYRDSPIYSDINLYVGTHSNKELVYNEDSINQNIFLIITTPIRSKWFRIRYGSNIPAYLFEPMDDMTASRIRTEIRTLLSRNDELRVTITKVNVYPNYTLQAYGVEVYYTAPNLDGKPVLFQFALNKQNAA
jgi:Phage baseplate assembly protein W